MGWWWRILLTEIVSEVERNSTLHVGDELHRALNRMDFFRLFKSLATASKFSEFGLVELSSEAESFRYESEMHLHSWASMQLGELDKRFDRTKDVPISQLLTSAVPSVITAVGDELPSPLMLFGEGETMVAIPLTTPMRRRYGLLLIGRSGGISTEELAQVSYEAAIIFQRYYEVILSIDFQTNLSEREIQLVLLTSEGNTSAEIAKKLKLSEHTVNSYTATILRKLKVVNRAHMVAVSIRAGLIN